MADEHDPDPHHTPQGEWVCAVKDCGRKLMGSYLRPVIPWKHRPEKVAAETETTLPGLGTTE
jgi:hypothetical protein